MSSFVQNGNTFKVIPDGAMNLQEKLPAKSFTISQNPMTGEYFLVSVPDLKVSNKIYGSTERRAKKILNTFDNRPHTTGVLLVGRKGTGKTMLSKLVSQKAKEEYGCPTIVINEPHSGEGFNQFISNITQPCVIIFDEFEKVYDKQQEALLTLFDGVYPTKKLFLVTSNNENRINEFMWNRPGRIFYRFSYGDIPDTEIRDYLKDNLQKTEDNYFNRVFESVKLIDGLSYDILRAVVEDLNRYPDENIQDLFEELNIDMQSDEFRWRITDIRSPSRPGIEDQVDKVTQNGHYSIFDEATMLSYVKPKVEGQEKPRGPSAIETIYIDPDKIVSYRENTATLYDEEQDIFISLKKEVEKTKKKFFFMPKGD